MVCPKQFSYWKCFVKAVLLSNLFPTPPQGLQPLVNGKYNMAPKSRRGLCDR